MMFFCVLLATFPFPDGTVIALEHSKIIVEVATKNPITHTAIILNEDGKPFVYEATPPVVRKLSYEKYINELIRRKELRPNLKLWIAVPKKPYKSKEIRGMKNYAESELGSEYSIKGYTKDIVTEQLHCSQFVTNILSKTDKFWSGNPGKVTPQSLWESLDNEYTKDSIPLPRSLPPPLLLNRSHSKAN